MIQDPVNLNHASVDIRHLKDPSMRDKNNNLAGSLQIVNKNTILAVL